MCTNPLTIPIKDGKHLIGERTVECRTGCTTCIKKHHRWWTGRLNAQAATSHSVWFLTLTYSDAVGGDHAQFLQYRDIQLLMKRIRNKKHRVSYVVVGEYGEKKGRAHWHLLLFWETPPPPVEMDNPKFHWDFWKCEHTDEPLGFVQIERPRSVQGSLSYILKYFNKELTKKGRDEADPRNVLKYSQGLGAKYLEQWAAKQAENGLPLFKTDNLGNVQDRYTVPGNVNPNNGQPFWYHVGRDNCLEPKMLLAYLKAWARFRPEQLLPKCDDVRDYLEELMQDPIADGPLELYGNTHYGYPQPGVFGPDPRDPDETFEEGAKRWEKIKAANDLEGLPNLVQARMYRSLRAELLQSELERLRPNMIPSLPPQRRPSRRTGPRLRARRSANFRNVHSPRPLAQESRP